MSGSEQFLGQQLTRQAQALETLVVKMGEMIQGIDASIPKFSITSQNIQVEKIYGVKLLGKNTPIKIKVFVSGEIKLTLKVYGSVGGTTTFTIKKNGVTEKTNSITNYATVNIEKNIVVAEGDEIEFSSDGNYAYIEQFQIRYDLINKPNQSIAD